MNRFINTLSLVLLSLYFLGVPTPASEKAPNILLITVDDLNDWVGCLGGHPQAITPNIDRLAQQGSLFLNATCQAPICGPSRASFLTGRYPSSLGLYGQSNKDLVKDTDNYMGHLIPEYFSRHGYKTFAGGKITHGGSDLKKIVDVVGPRQSFGPKPKPAKGKELRYHYRPDTSLPFTGTQTDWGQFPEVDQDMPDYQIANWAVEVLENPPVEPWFLAVGFMRPHVPFYVPEKWFEPFPLNDISLPPLPPGDNDLSDIPEISRALHEAPRYPGREFLRANNNEQWKRCVQAYLACTYFVDAQIGKVLEAVPDDTITVLVSDHGYHLGEKDLVCKHTLWPESLRIPMIVKHPEIGQGYKISQPVGLIDIYPTLCEFADLPVPERLEGLSLQSLLKTEQPNWNRPAILSTYGMGNHSLRTTTHHYIRFEDGSEEYYDLVKDPHAWNNLASTTTNEELQPLRSMLPKTEAKLHPASSTKPHNSCFRDFYQRHKVE